MKQIPKNPALRILPHCGIVFYLPLSVPAGAVFRFLFVRLLRRRSAFPAAGQPVNLGGHISRAIPVINIHCGNAVRAGIQHGKKR